MKEHLLNANDRAAFQGLIALAGAIGIGALLAGSFFDRSGARDRDVGLTVFEVFSVVAILTASAMTAYFSIEYLHAGEAVSGAQFGQVGAPLVGATALLALLRATSRFTALPGGLGNHLATIAVTAFGAVVIAFVISLQTSEAEYVVPGSGLILIIGALIGWFFLQIERFFLNDNERKARIRVATRAAAGYEPEKTVLGPGLPEAVSGLDGLKVVVWKKKDRIYLDQTESRRLQVAVEERWADLAAGQALPPLKDAMLIKLDLTTKLVPWPPRFLLTVETSTGGQVEAPKPAEVNSDGLFDITDLGIA